MNDRYLKPVMGCLLGTAVGDAMGLPYRGLSRMRIHRYHTPIKGQSLILTKAMFSPRTEHTCMSAQSLIVSGGDPTQFIHDLARRMRLWLLTLPAGIDLATLKSALRLWSGCSPEQSGSNSTGNDAAMRSGIIGVCYGAEPDKLLALVEASTVITHNNDKANLAAIAVAVAAYLASVRSSIQPEEYYQTLQEFVTHPAVKLPDVEVKAFLVLIERACLSAEQNESGVIFVDRLSNYNGVSGYAYHTVPVIIQVWLRNQRQYSEGIKEIIYLGGDTNATAAILGGIIGASVGISGIRQRWLNDIIDFPRSVDWIKSLSKQLARSCEIKTPQPALSLAFYWLPLRNLMFLIVILFHAFYRLLPF